MKDVKLGLTGTLSEALTDAITGGVTEALIEGLQKSTTSVGCK